jgi:hypothetical protein
MGDSHMQLNGIAFWVLSFTKNYQLMPNSKKSSDASGRNNDSQDQKQKTAADFDQTVRQAEEEKGTLKPGQSQGGNSKQHNNGRGGGK